MLNCSNSTNATNPCAPPTLGFSYEPLLVLFSSIVVIFVVTWLGRRMMQREAKQANVDLAESNETAFDFHQEETGPITAPDSMERWEIYNSPSGMKSGCDWKSPVLTALTVLGSTLQNASLNFWLTSFGAPFPWSSSSVAPFSSPYFVLTITSVAFIIIFGLIIIAYRIIVWRNRKLNIPSFRRYGLNFFTIGFCTALNGFLIVFASPAFRTPPILQGLLPNTGILWAILLTPIVVGKKNSPIPICAWQPLLVIMLILGGAALAVSPLIIDLVNGSAVFYAAGTSPIYVIEWSAVFMFGFLPGVAINVFQEAFFKFRKREGGERSFGFDMNYMLFWSIGVAQLASVLFLWFIPLIPNYGLPPQPTVAEFWIELGATTQCFFGALPNCSLAFPLFVVFVGGFLLNSFTSAALNESSAVYNTIATTLSSPIVTLFFVIFPALNFGQGSFPLWSTLPSLGILIFAVAFYKLWENRLKRQKLAKHFSSPALPSETKSLVN